MDICFKMNARSSELPFHVHNWLIITLKDFCFVIKKWSTFWPSNCKRLKFQFGNFVLHLDKSDMTF